MLEKYCGVDGPSFYTATSRGYESDGVISCPARDSKEKVQLPEGYKSPYECNYDAKP